MQIWNYHSITGELLGTSTADPNPVEAGEWLIPAHATPIEPPAAQTGMAVVFAGGSWGCAPDHRGETWWWADAEDNTAPVLVGFIGDPVEFDPPLTNVEPPAPPAPPPPPIVVSARQIRMALTRLELRRDFEAYVASADQDTKDIWQFGTEFREDDATIAAALAALGKEPVELFDLAKTL